MSDCKPDMFPTKKLTISMGELDKLVSMSISNSHENLGGGGSNRRECENKPDFKIHDKTIVLIFF